MIFIVGRGRSGTTLLSRLLNQHPLISVSKEGMFLLNLKGKYQTTTIWNNHTLQLFVTDLLSDQRMVNWQLDKNELIKFLHNQVSLNSNYNTVCRLVYRYYAKLNGKSNQVLLIDKNPHHSLFLNQLIQLFPESKFIFITRNPLDNVLSYKKVNFDFNDSGLLAVRWKLFNDNILLFKKLHNDIVHTIKYESLVLQPEKSLKKICSFIKVDYSPQLLSFHKNENSQFDWHKHLAEPINTNHIGKGEIEISNHDKELIASICNSTSQKLGYSIIGNTNFTYFKTLPMFLFAYLRTTGEKLFFHIPFTIRIVFSNFLRKNIFK